MVTSVSSHIYSLLVIGMAIFSLIAISGDFDFSVTGSPIVSSPKAVDFKNCVHKAEDIQTKTVKGMKKFETSENTVVTNTNDINPCTGISETVSVLDLLKNNPDSRDRHGFRRIEFASGDIGYVEYNDRPLNAQDKEKKSFFCTDGRVMLNGAFCRA